MYGGLSWSCFMDTQKHKECYYTCLSVAMMLTFNFVWLESVWRLFWWLPSIRIAHTQCKSLVFIICKNPPTFAAFVILSVSPPLPIPHLPPLFSFFYSPRSCSPSSALFAVTFHAVYLSTDSAPHPGTGPQFPRQLYNCFGCVPSATGYRGIIDVKRNMYETRRCERPPYGSVRSLTRGNLSVFQ